MGLQVMYMCQTTVRVCLELPGTSKYGYASMDPGLTYAAGLLAFRPYTEELAGFSSLVTRGLRQPNSD